jgi:hypothetical protein
VENESKATEGDDREIDTEDEDDKPDREGIQFYEGDYIEESKEIETN